MLVRYKKLSRNIVTITMMISIIGIGLFTNTDYQESIVFASEPVPRYETSEGKWPNTQNKPVKNYFKTEILDFSQEQYMDEDFGSTPSLSKDSTITIYIHGQQIPIESMPRDQRSGNTIFRTDQLGEDTYIIVTNAMSIWDETSKSLKSLNLKLTLRSQDLTQDPESTIGLGLNPRNFLQVGGGNQRTERGNFLRMHYLFFDNENQPKAVKFHLGYTDIDFDEAISIEEHVVDTLYVNKDTILPYHSENGFLFVTRDYNDPTDKNDTNDTQNHVILFAVSSPAEGFDIAITTSRAKYDVELYPGSQIAPKIISNLKFVGYNKIHFIDEEGNVISPSIDGMGKTGDEYTTKPKEIDGYELVPEKTIGKESSIYGDGDLQEVVYVYRKKIPKIGKITVEYLDEEGNSLVPKEEQSGNVDEDYQTVPKEIEGYELIELPSNKDGKYSEEEQTIKYIYRKKEPKKGNLIISFVDSEGNDLSEKITETHIVDTDYQTKPKKIPGYRLKEVPVNEKGIIVEGDTFVKYIYEKIEKPNIKEPTPPRTGKIKVKFVDDMGKDLINEMEMVGKIGQDYQTIPKEIEGYELIEIPSNKDGQYQKDEQEIKYVYRKKIEKNRKNGIISIEYVDENGNKISNTDKKTGNPGEGYITIPKEIEGYELIEVPVNKNGRYVEGEQKITYIYRKIEKSTSSENDKKSDSTSNSKKNDKVSNSVHNNSSIVERKTIINDSEDGKSLKILPKAGTTVSHILTFVGIIIVTLILISVGYRKVK
ncbi:MucBP domain-containing protein [Enterococcus faecalis]|uniref:MucBP domain-containing protein n=1 Tax=Enterococcus faecalis TaxID=1351 RepID=UPI002DBD00DA|nr:MucBP domain-containing protein [Enterococcus faecalis]MEB7792084.1 MucBP domain-containing protein [Enterococcus faecalis]MEB7810072.1 MucBP domain-containing protein [Enterococcus faecalis]